MARTSKHTSKGQGAAARSQKPTATNSKAKRQEKRRIEGKTCPEPQAEKTPGGDGGEPIHTINDIDSEIWEYFATLDDDDDARTVDEPSNDAVRDTHYKAPPLPQNEDGGGGASPSSPLPPSPPPQIEEIGGQNVGVEIIVCMEAVC